EGKQLIFASDRRPSDLTGLEDRLRTRFEGGLVVEVQSPDRELRERLFEHFLQNGRTPPSAELLSYLSDRPAASVRDVIGLVNRVLAAAEVADVPLTLAVARAELEPASNGDRDGAMRAAADPYFLDDEKVVWTWPDPAARLIEELR